MTHNNINRFGYYRTIEAGRKSVNLIYIHALSLKDIHEEFDYIHGNVVVVYFASHILGLLLIPGIKRIIIDHGLIDTIMNKYLGTGDIISAQDELIDAGFKEQAKL